MCAKISSAAYPAARLDLRISVNRVAEKAGQTLPAETQNQDTASLDAARTETTEQAAIEQDTIENFKRTSKPQDYPDELFSNHLQLKSMLEQMKRFDARKAAENSALNDKFRLQAKKSYSIMDSYVRLANADSKAQVKNVMGAVRRKISNFRKGTNQGSNMERAQAQAAIASAKKLLLQGNRKIKQLDEETLSKLRTKRAASSLEISRAQKIDQETTRLRRARFIANSHIISEGMLSEMNNFVRLRHYHDQDDRLKEVTSGFASIPYASPAFVCNTAVSPAPIEGSMEPAPIDVSI